MQTVALLFTDLVGSTALASRLGRSRAETVRSEHFGILREAIAASGGQEVKNLGDGLMVAFSSAGAALACGVAMQQRVDARNRSTSPPLAVRIGVAVGDAVLDDQDWFGPPAVEAARLCAAADGGQVLASEAVRLIAASADGPRMRPLGPLDLKGLPEPVSAWSVEWEPLPAAAETLPLPPSLAEPATTSFVGRRAELERLAETWARALSGERRLVLVAGEPGIGKTRLAAHAAIQAQQDGAIVLYGRSDEDVGLPYQPWRQALSGLVEWAPDDLLRRHVAGHGGDLVRLAPGLGARVESVPEPQATDPETERYLLFGATMSLLQDAARQAPVLLVLDDLHWAARPTLALLKHLHLAGPPMRLLVLGMHRDTGLGSGAAVTELLGDLRRAVGVDRVALDGLDEADVRSLLESTAGRRLDGSGAGLVRELHHETGGNPFFVTEMARHLSESGAMAERADGRIATTIGRGGLDLPRSVQEVISGRVSRLGEQAERLLRSAAVIGRDFDVPVLARITRMDEDDVLDMLDSAVAAALVAETPGRAGRFSFVHVLVTHTLEHGLSIARRARLHERIANALEANAVEGTEPPLAELAIHWEAAGGTAAQRKALGYAARAGRVALEELAPDAAEAWFERALALHAALPDRDPAERRELLLELGIAQLQAGRPDFRETLLEVASEARRAGDDERLVRAAIANSRGFFSSAGFVDDERVEVLEAALERAPADDPARARLLALLASELLWSGEHERRRALSDEAVALAREAGDAGGLASVLTLRIAAVWWPETLPDRLVATAELVALADRLGDPQQRFWALVWRAITTLQAGDRAETDRHLATQREISERLGQPRVRYVLGTQEAWRAQLAGEVDEAERLAQAAMEIGMEVGEPDALSLYAAQLGPIRWQQGRLAEVADLLEQIAGDVPGVAVFAAMHALSELERGEHDRASALLEAAVRDGFAIPSDPVQLGTLVLWGELAARVRSRRAAAALLPRLEPLREHIVLDALGTLGAAGRSAGLLAGTLRRWEEADAFFAQALATHERLHAAALVARTRLEWGLTLADGPPERLSEARDLLAGAATETGALELAGLERRAVEALVQLDPGTRRTAPSEADPTSAA